MNRWEYPLEEFCKGRCRVFDTINYIQNIGLLSRTEKQEERISEIRRKKCDICIATLLLNSKEYQQNKNYQRLKS